MLEVKTDPWVQFRQLLTLHEAEREELLESGVALHRVDALYPLDFEHLFQQSSAHLLEQGLPAGLKESHWRSNIAVAYALRECITGEERKMYEQQWAEHYGKKLSIYAQVQQRLHGLGYDYSDADYFSGWYGRMLFVTYWLVLNPESSTAASPASESLMRFIAANLLFKTIAQA